MCEKHLSKAIDLSIPAMPWTLPSYVLQLFRHSCISPSMYLDWTIPDSHGKTILQFSHAYPCCLWPLPTILLQFMQSPLPVVTVVTNPPPPIGPTLRSRNSNPLHCLWSPTGHRHTQPDTGLKLEKQIICAATKEYVPKFQLATIITTSHSGLTNCNYCLVIVWQLQCS